MHPDEIMVARKNLRWFASFVPGSSLGRPCHRQKPHCFFLLQMSFSHRLVVYGAWSWTLAQGKNLVEHSDSVFGPGAKAGASGKTSASDLCSDARCKFCCRTETFGSKELGTRNLMVKTWQDTCDTCPEICELEPSRWPVGAGSLRCWGILGRFCVSLLLGGTLAGLPSGACGTSRGATDLITASMISPSKSILLFFSSNSWSALLIISLTSRHCFLGFHDLAFPFSQIATILGTFWDLGPAGWWCRCQPLLGRADASGAHIYGEADQTVRELRGNQNIAALDAATIYKQAAIVRRDMKFECCRLTASCFFCLVYLEHMMVATIYFHNH